MRCSLDEGTVPVGRNQLQPHLVGIVEGRDLHLIDGENQKTIPALIMLLVIPKLVILSVGLPNPRLFIDLFRFPLVREKRLTPYLSVVTDIVRYGDFRVLGKSNDSPVKPVMVNKGALK